MIQGETARTGVESQAAEAREERSPTSVLLIFFINLIGFWFILPAFLLFLGFLLDDIFSVPSLAGPEVVRLFFGSILLSSGLLLSLYSILLFAYYGDGMPIASLPPKRLVMQGPYSRSRHPIYLGYTVSLIGLGLIFESLSFLAGILPLFTLFWLLYVVVHEEKVLQKRYGAHYLSYKRKVPFLFSSATLGKRNEPNAPPILYMLSAVLLRAVIKCCYAIEVSGNPAPDVTPPYVLVTNHANYLDPFFINACFGAKDFMHISASEKFFRNPVLRTYFGMVGVFATPRYEFTDIATIRRTLHFLRHGISVGIFPEGERSWDGRPVEISDTFIRFLQKAGCPIVAVNLSGNYNLFPRWARRPRRGKVKIHFHHPFHFQKNETVDQCRKALQERLFSPNSSYDDAVLVMEDNIADGLPLFLWRCPLCRTNDSLFVEKGVYLVCSCCASKWKLLPNYHLKLLQDRGKAPSVDSSGSLAEWYARVESLYELAPLRKTYPFLEETEKVFLESEPIKYSSYKGLTKTFSRRGRIILTDQRFLFLSRDLLISEQLGSMKKIVIEGNNQLEIGFAERMASIKFRCESPLKWQTYIRRIRGGACRPT